jgi:class 3 adenylate cyclase
MNCASCGHDNPDPARFCLECGAAVVGAASEYAAMSPARHSPRATTSQHLADKIRQSKSALEGERKQVTVLFADVKGSMDLAEQLDPEEWSQIMQRFFQILSEGVAGRQGAAGGAVGATCDTLLMPQQCRDTLAL